jgi:hypothetical protein
MIKNVNINKLYMRSVPNTLVKNSPHVKLLKMIDANKFDIDKIIGGEYVELLQKINPEIESFDAIKTVYEYYNKYMRAKMNGLDNRIIRITKKNVIVKGETKAVFACVLGEEYIYGEIV